jgi:hypothetical protein
MHVAPVLRHSIKVILLNARALLMRAWRLEENKAELISCAAALLIGKFFPRTVMKTPAA